MATTLTPNTTAIPAVLDGTPDADNIFLAVGQTAAYPGGVRLRGNNDYLAGSNDAELIYGGNGDDGIILGNGNDTGYGDKGNDTLFGRDGDDLIFGFGGNDFLSGEIGNDSIRGGNGADYLFGGLGFDRLKGDFGPDTLTGGADGDLFVYSPRTEANFDVTQIDLITDFSEIEGDKIAIPVGTALDNSSFVPTFDANADSVPDFVIRLETQQILGVVLNNPGIQGDLTFNESFFLYSNPIF